MNKAKSSIQVDNERVRVTEWTFAPNSHTGWHRHEFDYVITPVTDGSVEIAQADATRTPFQMVAGQSYFRQAGVEHDVINVGSQRLVFVETEIK